MSQLKQLLKTHGTPNEEHGWTPQSTDHIKNVPLTESHFLMRCPCGWYGWVKKENLPHFVNSPPTTPKKI